MLRSAPARAMPRQQDGQQLRSADSLFSGLFAEQRTSRPLSGHRMSPAQRRGVPGVKIRLMDAALAVEGAGASPVRFLSTPCKRAVFGLAGKRILLLTGSFSSAAAVGCRSQAAPEAATVRPPPPAGPGAKRHAYRRWQGPERERCIPTAVDQWNVASGGFSSIHEAVPVRTARRVRG